MVLLIDWLVELTCLYYWRTVCAVVWLLAGCRLHYWWISWVVHVQGVSWCIPWLQKFIV